MPRELSIPSGTKDELHQAMDEAFILRCTGIIGLMETRIKFNVIRVDLKNKTTIVNFRTDS